MALIGRARVFGLTLVAAAAGTSPVGTAEFNDYPTAARADYVFACMKTNGDTRQALEQCSCSIDVIASILPYDRLRRSGDSLEPLAGAGPVRHHVPVARASENGDQ